MAKKQGRVMLTECPNCSAIWGPGSEEWEFQQCDSCGYPDPDCEEFGKDEDKFPDDDYDQFCEDNNPNDSRNI